ncbi:hypothetical protein ckin111_12100 [Helicobacter pylori]
MGEFHAASRQKDLNFLKQNIEDLNFLKQNIEDLSFLKQYIKHEFFKKYPQDPCSRCKGYWGRFLKTHARF